MFQECSNKNKKKSHQCFPVDCGPICCIQKPSSNHPNNLVACFPCLPETRERDVFFFFHFIFGNPCNVMSISFFFIFGQKSIFLASVDFFIPPSLSLEAFCRSDCTAYDFGFIFRNASCHFPSFFIYLCTVRKYCFFSLTRLSLLHF